MTEMFPTLRGRGTAWQIPDATHTGSDRQVLTRASEVPFPVESALRDAACPRPLSRRHREPKGARHSPDGPGSTAVAAGVHAGCLAPFGRLLFPLLDPSCLSEDGR